MFISCNRENYKEVGSNMAIIIDGIIGAGKTTVGHLVSEHFNMPFYQEIKSEDGMSLTQRMLDRFYEDPNRWSAIIQTMFLSERFKDMKAVQNNHHQAIFDRSIYGDEIFARTIHSRGQMSDDEFLIYQNVLKNMLPFIEKPDLLVYLDVSVDTALKRIQKRARSTEAELIPRDYMMDLKKHYDRWFDEYDLSPKIKIDFNTIMIDDNDKLVPDVAEDILKRMETHIEKNNSSSC